MAEAYRVTVNGTVYEVEVEAMGGTQSAAPVAKAAPSAAPKAAPATPAPAPQAAPVAAPAGGETVSSPMPGKILRVVAAQGSTVAEGEVLLILEAMKMENEIVAPVGGTVTQMAAKEGATVNSGDVLAVIG